MHRLINNAAVPDIYTIPHIQDLSSNLAGSTIFSVDLTRGYHHIPMNKDDIPKTAKVTPFGSFEFLHMPFGLKNAAQTSQRLRNTVCRGLEFIFNNNNSNNNLTCMALTIYKKLSAALCQYMQIYSTSKETRNTIIHFTTRIEVSLGSPP